MERQKQLRNAYYREVNFAAPFEGKDRDQIIRMRLRDYNARKKMGFSDKEIDDVIRDEGRALSQLLRTDRFGRWYLMPENSGYRLK